MSADKRTKLVTTAMRLFASSGYNAVGVDRIIAESGISKMTMYKYFPSKNDLIVEALLQRDLEFREAIRACVAEQVGVFEQIKAIFVWHHEWFNHTEFFGCMFINSAAEFHDPEHAIHAIAAQHKAAVISLMESILRPAYQESALMMANRLNLLLDGAIVAAHVNGSKQAAMEAWTIAETLLQLDGVKPLTPS